MDMMVDDNIVEQDSEIVLSVSYPTTSSFSHNDQTNHHCTYHNINNHETNNERSTTRSERIQAHRKYSIDNNSDTDFTIILPENALALHVHRQVLTKSSMFFEACFHCGMIEALTGEMILSTGSVQPEETELQDIEEEIGDKRNASETSSNEERLFHDMIHSFYSGDFSHVPMTQASKLISLMNQYQVTQDWIRRLLRHMELNLTFEHVLSVFEIPEFLLEQCICGQKLLARANTVLKDKEGSKSVFTENIHFDLGMDLLVPMLQSFVTIDNYRSANEFIAKWLSHEQTMRAEFADQLYSITRSFEEKDSNNRPPQRTDVVPEMLRTSLNKHVRSKSSNA